MKNLQAITDRIEIIARSSPGVIQKIAACGIAEKENCHPERTALLSLCLYEHAFAEKSDTERVELLVSALTHDIGKNGIQEEILDKPGSLTETEYGNMQTHVLKTHWILSRCTALAGTDIPLIASSHHERWNGSGYPAGLKGDEIHRFARIITVADIYDALYHERGYRKQRYSKEEVITIMHTLRGTFCEPRIVDILTSLLCA